MIIDYWWLLVIIANIGIDSWLLLIISDYYDWLLIMIDYDCSLPLIEKKTMIDLLPLIVDSYWLLLIIMDSWWWILIDSYWSLLITGGARNFAWDCLSIQVFMWSKYPLIGFVILTGLTRTVKNSHLKQYYQAGFDSWRSPVVSSPVGLLWTWWRFGRQPRKWGNSNGRSPDLQDDGSLLTISLQLSRCATGGEKSHPWMGSRSYVGPRPWKFRWLQGLQLRSSSSTINSSTRQMMNSDQLESWTHPPLTSSTRFISNSS